jgi:hypothetical protein
MVRFSHDKENVVFKRCRSAGRRNRPLPRFQESSLDPGAGLRIGHGLDHLSDVANRAPRRVESHQACLPFLIRAGHDVIQTDAKENGGSRQPGQAALPHRAPAAAQLLSHGLPHPRRDGRIGAARR